MPTTRIEPRRKHGSRHSRSPSPIASVFRRLRRNRPPSPGHRPRKEGGVFNRLGGKEQSASARYDSRHSSHAKGTEVQLRKHHHRGTSPRGNNRYSESEDSEGGHWKSKPKRHKSNTYEDDLSQPWTSEERNPSHLGSGISISQGQGCLAMSRHTTEAGLQKDTLKATPSAWQKQRVGQCHWSDQKPDRFSLLTKTSKEIFALEKGKFKAPPPMVTPVEKRDPNKYCEFHEDTGHSMDECMQLRKQIDKMIKSGKLSQFIKELKQNDKPKAQKKGETARKDKPLAILMIQPWERAPARNKKPDDPSYHITHRIKWKNHLADRPDILLVKIGDEEHSTSAWMNFMVTRSPSQHNEIIGKTGIRKIRAVPSTAHEMLKFLVKGGTVTIRRSKVIPIECAMISGPNTQQPVTSQVLEEKIKVVIHPEYPEQTIAIGSTLTEKGRKELCALLRQNLDVFAWKPADMTGVPRHITEHRLNVREECLPIR
ncbi:hypothetical protein Tco_0740891 [Tanacetum coccineum]